MKGDKDPRIRTFLLAFEQGQGYPITNWGKEGAAARRVLQLGYTVEQILACRKAMSAEAFWHGKHIPLASILTQVGPFLAASGPARERWATTEDFHKGGDIDDKANAL